MYPLETRLLHIKSAGLAADRPNYSNYHVNIFLIKGKSQNFFCWWKIYRKTNEKLAHVGIALIHRTKSAATPDSGW